MSIMFFSLKNGLSPLPREFITRKSTFISFFRHFIALKSVVIPYEDGRNSNEDGRHGTKALKLPLNIREAVCPYL